MRYRLICVVAVASIAFNGSLAKSEEASLSRRDYFGIVEDATEISQGELARLIGVPLADIRLTVEMAAVNARLPAQSIRLCDLTIKEAGEQFPAEGDSRPAIVLAYYQVRDSSGGRRYVPLTSCEELETHIVDITVNELETYFSVYLRGIDFINP